MFWWFSSIRMEVKMVCRISSLLVGWQTYLLNVNFSQCLHAVEFVVVLESKVKPTSSPSESWWWCAVGHSYKLQPLYLALRNLVKLLVCTWMLNLCHSFWGTTLIIRVSFNKSSSIPKSHCFTIDSLHYPSPLSSERTK